MNSAQEPKHLVAWIRQESSGITHLWRLTDSEVSSLFSGLSYPCNKVHRSSDPATRTWRRAAGRTQRKGRQSGPVWLPVMSAPIGKSVEHDGSELRLCERAE